MKLYTRLTKNGISLRDKELANFSFDSGASEERSMSYYRTLLNSGRLEERAEDGKIWVGSPDAWEMADKEMMMKKNQSLDEHK